MPNSTASATVEANGKWIEATKKNPCPICSKARRCKIAPDANAVLCFRSDQPPAGWYVAKLHDSGATFRRDAVPKPQRKRSSSNAPATVKQLSPERLHDAYAQLIEKLSLSALHGSDLVKRGLTKDEIDRRQYRSMPLSADTRAKIAAELAETLGDDFISVPGFGFKDGTPTLFGAGGMLIPIRNVRGQIVAALIRSDCPNDDNKYTALSSKKYDGNSPGSPGHVPLGVVGPFERVRIVEGHLKGDVITALDEVPTISCGGVSNWRKGIDSAKELGVKVVRVAFDADARTNDEVARSLLSLVQALRNDGFAIELDRWPPEDGKGLDDLLAAGKKPEVLGGDDAMAAAIEIAKAAGVSTENRTAKRNDKNGKDSGGKTEKSTEELIIELKDYVHWFHDLDREAYVCYRVGPESDFHRETSRLNAKPFRLWVKHWCYEREEKCPIVDLLDRLEIKAIYEGAQEKVHVRVAEGDGAIFLDLCNERWQAVRIDRTGWRVIDDPPVKFRRARAMRELPLPDLDGDVGELRRFINVTDDDWPLLLAWLVAAMRPIGPYPVLAVYGEQGSAKSTLCRYVRQLIDPNVAPLRAEYREPRDLMIGANNGWVVALENLSVLPPWLSDCLCRLATGGGFSTRTLYENDEETIFDSKRPVIINCIDDIVTRSDLLDRCVILNLPRISENKRISEKQLDLEFATALPRILGGVLTAVSAALRNEEHVKLPTLPRMADFAIWATAAEPAFGLRPGTFIRAYTANRAAGNESAIEASPVGRVIIEFVGMVDRWSGTSTELLAILDERTDEKTRKMESWPKSPRAFSSRLKRLAPNLREAGIGVEFIRQGHKGTRTVVLSCEARQTENSSSAASAALTVKEVARAGARAADASGGANRDADANGCGASPSDSPEVFGHNGDADAADAKAASDSNDMAEREVIEWSA
jgi:hypothetical protein